LLKNYVQDVEVSEENLKPKHFAEDYTKYPEVGSATNVQSVKSDVLQMVPGVDVKQVNDSQKTAALGTSISSFTVNFPSAAPGLSSNKYFQDNTERTKELPNTNSLRDPQRASYQLPGETFSFPKSSNVTSVSGSSYVDGSGYQNKNFTVGATNANAANVPGSIRGKPLFVKDANVESPVLYPAATIPGSLGGKPFLVKDVNVESPGISSACRPVQSGGQLTSIGAESSHFSLPGNSTTGKSSIRKSHPSNEQRVNSSKPGISTSDLSKQFGNVLFLEIFLGFGIVDGRFFSHSGHY